MASTQNTTVPDAPNVPAASPTTLVELIAALNPLEFQQAVDYVKSLGLITRYERGATSRFLITHDKLKTPFINELQFRANGVIYDTVAKRVLCVPAMACNYRPKLDDVSHMLQGASRVYRVQDGTIVNLYWDATAVNGTGSRVGGSGNATGAWRMGSANGIDVSGYRWMGSNTFREEFDVVMRMYPGFALDALNKSATHIVGFRTHSFHPFKLDPIRAWHITSLDNATYAELGCDIGLPRQEEVTPVGDTAAARLAWIQDACNAASSKLPAEICYGFVIRAGDPDYHGTASNVLMESSLMKRIRKAMYNLPKRTTLDINHTNRLHYNSLKAYLNYMKRKDFLSLFPEHTARWAEYAAFVKRVQDRMLQCYRNRNLRTTLPLVKNLQNGPLSVDGLAALFMTYVNQTGAVNVMTKEFEGIIYNCIVDTKYIDLYFRAMGAVSEPQVATA